jgi:hypothetical protein
MMSIRKVVARSLWMAQTFFVGMCAVWTLGFLVITERPILSLWFGLKASAVATFLFSSFVFLQLMFFEYRWFWYRRLDVRVPRKDGKRSSCLNSRPA